jgi:hypothetical protein
MGENFGNVELGWKRCEERLENVKEKRKGDK